MLEIRVLILIWLKIVQGQGRLKSPKEGSAGLQRIFKG